MKLFQDEQEGMIQPLTMTELDLMSRDTLDLYALEIWAYSQHVESNDYFIRLETDWAVNELHKRLMRGAIGYVKEVKRIDNAFYLTHRKPDELPMFSYTITTL
jgi:hypothetical protein